MKDGGVKGVLNNVKKNYINGREGHRLEIENSWRAIRGDVAGDVAGFQHL